MHLPLLPIASVRAFVVEDHFTMAVGYESIFIDLSTVNPAIWIYDLVVSLLLIDVDGSDSSNFHPLDVR